MLYSCTHIATVGVTGMHWKKLRTRIWCGRNRNCRFKLDFSIRSLSVMTSCNHRRTVCIRHCIWCA